MGSSLFAAPRFVPSLYFTPRTRRTFILRFPSTAFLFFPPFSSLLFPQLENELKPLEGGVRVR